MNSNAVLRVQAASSVTGNNTKTTAYNCGSWNSMNSLPTAILHADQHNAIATAKSMMRNVNITIDYQYDLANTEYKIFTK